MTRIVRAQVAHTPRNPFVHESALEAFEDGAVAFSAGRVVAVGSWALVRGRYPEAEVVDARDAVLLPGFVDCPVHYPQIRGIGAMGLGLLDWLRLRALPEEARLADSAYAAVVAEQFVRGLAANGTTTALVFGSHFADAQDALLSPALAVELSGRLIERWHGRGLLRYAVSPRFSVSCSDELLSACGSLGREFDGLLFTTHLNETPGEAELVSSLFPWARDYLETYERFGLVGGRSVFAHDVHVSDDELRRLTAAGATVCH